MLSALSALRTSELLGSVNSTTSGASSAKGASNISATGTTSVSSADLNSESKDASSPLSKDTVQLLKDLAIGNLSAAKTDVARLQKDLKAQGGASASSDTGLTKLLDSISKSLDGGSTGNALSTLAGYLIQTGNTSGSIVNTTA